MNRILGSKYFWLLVFLVAAVVFAVGINSKKSYQADVKVLILPRSGFAAQSADQAVENAIEIPRSLTFYDKLIEFNPEINGPSPDLPDDQRSKDWNSKIRIKRVDNSGIVSISAFDDDQAQAENLAVSVARDLEIVMGRYYSFENDFSLGIIDGPITYMSSKGSIASWAVIGLIAGFLASLAVFYAFGFSDGAAPRESGRKEPKISLEELSRFDFGKPKKGVRPEKKAEAPVNLPIVDSVEPENDGTRSADNPLESAVSEEIPQEPTPEEVRKRLNKLLRGN